MLLAAETGNIKIAEYLLNLGINTYSSNEDINAQYLAYENGHFDVLLSFLQHNLPYPSTIDINNCSKDINEFHQIAVNLHDAVISKNVDKVVEIIGQNPQLRHFYNTNNQSAPTVALINKQTDMYKLLITHNIHFGSHENTDGIMENFEYGERRDLREFHNQHAKDLPEKHLNALMTCSVVAHDATDVNQKPDLVMGAFKLLNEILLIRIILKIVAASKKLQMVFDFNRESVEVADPTVNSNTFGLFYLTGRIYIGALCLLNNATRCETLGTMAHELCHYAMHLTFNNYAKPYRKDDKEAIAEFEEISQMCSENREENGFIKSVYDDYPEESHHAELIVRVPHILAFYSDEPEEIEKCQKTFKQLFYFYEHKVVSEMEKALPDIESKVDRESEQKDKKILKLVKIIIILIISSFIVVGLLVVILHKPDIKFEELSSANKEIVRTAIVSYKGVNVRLCDLFPDNSTVYDEFSSNHLRSLLDNEILDLNDPLLRFTDDLITHKWGTFSEPLRHKFLNSNFIFQNQSLKFIDLYDLIPTAYDELSSREIDKVLNGTELVIGTLHKPSIDNYIERKFSVQNSEEIKNLSEIINEAQDRRLLILSAVAGAGKTVTFEYLTVKIKEEFPLLWVSYVDLKKHTNLYDNSNAFDLLSKILNLDQKSKFEKKIFEEFFKSGIVNLLWNGFDEISPTYSKFIIDIIQNIQQTTNNVQFISTRPSYANDLETNLIVVPHVLIPLQKIEQQKFLTDFFKAQSKNDSIIKQNIEKVEKILKEINVGGSRDFNTPLMLRMVAEIQDDPKLNNSANLYQVYELFVIKKNRIWIDKGELAKHAGTDIFLTMSSINIVQIYQKFALLQEKLNFASSSLILKLSNLKILKKKIPENFPFEEISRLGILSIENEVKFEFSHRTFAEFFIAQYIIDNIYSLDDEISSYEAELRLQLFYKIISGDSRFIINLIHSYVRSRIADESNFNEVISELLRTKFKDFLLISAKWFIQSFEILIDFFKKDHQVLTELLRVNDKETLYTKTQDPTENTSQKRLIEYKFNETCSKYLTNEELHKFLNGIDQNSKILVIKKYYEITNRDFLESTNQALEKSNFWTFIDKTKQNSTESERKELLLFLSRLIFYFTGHNFNKYFDLNEYEKIWMEIEKLNFTTNEKREFVAKLLHNVALCLMSSGRIGVYRIPCDIISKIVFKHVSKLLTNYEIFKVFYDKNIFHKILKVSGEFYAPGFNSMWKYFTTIANEEQQQEILAKYDDGDDVFSANGFPPFRIKHLKLFKLNIQETAEDYFTGKSNAEVQTFFMDSPNFLIYFISSRNNEFICFKFALFLEDKFKGNENQLKMFINRKVKPRNKSIFEYFDGIIDRSFCLKFFTGLLINIERGKTGARGNDSEIILRIHS